VSETPQDRVSPAELAAEGGTALPDKEVMSLLDLNANLDLALDTAAPIDLAVGANANIAAPINAAVDANVLSAGSAAEAGALQSAHLSQGIVGDATATSHQDSGIAQGAPTTDSGSTAGTGGTTDGTSGTTGGTTTTTTGSPVDGDLLNVNVNLNGDLHLASPIDGAVAANANAAAPINASASANIGSIGAESVSMAQQDAVIDQHIDGNATATGDQASQITQQSDVTPQSDTVPQSDIGQQDTTQPVTPTNN
jgi:hypothetical protein